MMHLIKSDQIRAVLLIAAVAITGCGRPYAGASERSYEIATSLVTITARKMDGKLNDVETLISESLTANEIQPHEAEYLSEIIADAKAGNWEQAQTSARQILNDQVDR